MNYPFRPPFFPPRPWQLQFEGACDERAWHAAAELLAANPCHLDAIALSNPFPQVLAEFLVEAPLSALQLSKLPNSTKPQPQWRFDMVGRIIQAHLLKARESLACRNYSHVYYHIEAAILLRPRTVEQEVIVTTVLTEVALQLGRAEEGLAVARADLESDPTTEAPHPNDFRHTIDGDYHPALVPTLLRTAVSAGASTEFIDLGVRMIARHMHWPTWRSFALDSTARFPLQQSARNLLKADGDLSLGARSFLQVFASGRPFKESPPPHDRDDVDF